MSYPSRRLRGRSAHDPKVIPAMVSVTTILHAGSLTATWETNAPIMLKTMPA